MDAAEELSVLIASPLETEHVAAIAAADPRIRVLYEPDLLPVPRYAADHHGTPRRLDPAGLDRWRGMLAQAQVSFDFDWWAPADMATNCPRLEWVQSSSAGVGQYLERYGLLDSGLVVTTAAGVHAVPLAEFALTGVLHFVKGVPDLLRWKDARRWNRYATRELCGSTALVVGLGAIGRQVAGLFGALGVRVWGVGRPGRRYDIPGVSRVFAYTELDSALPHVDAVVLACPLTDQTRGLLDRARLRLLPEGALLVNIARGPVVDEPALVEALRDGHLGGAVLDVVAAEPLPSTSPLWDLDNVVISPHSAATVAAENGRIVEIFVDNLRRWLTGRPLRNLFDRERGY